MRSRGLCMAALDESGVAMALTLMTIVVLVTISAGLVAVARNEVHSARLGEASRTALALAEAGVERALFELRRDPDWSDAEGATALRTDTGEFPLCLDPTARGGCGAPARDLPFPAEEPLGWVTVELRTSGEPGCEGCLALRATARAAHASRRIEVVVRRDGGAVWIVRWREEL
jgi:hypothetical protein